MEARQQQIADLARHVLPFVEAREQKEALIKKTYQFLILTLTAITAFSSAEMLRPISYSEEKALSIIMEHNAMKHKTTVRAEAQPFLDYFGVYSISEMRAYQWNEALYRLTREPP
jgi:hypothetical protein